MKSYRDHTLGAKERASLLLKEMSLDEKMAQINCVFPFDQDAYNFEKIQQETKYGMGEVSTLEMRRMETLDEVAAWQRKVQKIVMENSAHRIPAIFHMRKVYISSQFYGFRSKCEGGFSELRSPLTPPA